MKALKIIIIALVVVIAVLLLVSFLLPSEVHVERSTEIDAPKEVVFAQVNDLKNWEKWSPWHNIDPDMTVTYEGPESGEGASYSWSSDHKNVGNGSLTITESNNNDYIKTEMNFMDEGTATSEYIFEEAGDGATKLTWTFDTDMGSNPVGRYMGLMMDKWIGADYEKGLASIKEVSEAAPAAPDIEVTEVTLAPQWYLSVQDTTPADSIGPALMTLYPKIVAYMKKNGIEQSGAPLAVYHSYSPETVIMSAGIPVQDSVTVRDGNIQLRKMEGRAIRTVYYGDYENMQETYDQLDAWMAANNMQPAGGPWEVYVTDPGGVTDTSKWETHIYYPVQ